jgi:hypothetical protein
MTDPMNRNVVIIVTMFMFLHGIGADTNDDDEPTVDLLAGVQIVDCEDESPQCLANGGPHAVYDAHHVTFCSARTPGTFIASLQYLNIHNTCTSASNKSQV